MHIAIDFIDALLDYCHALGVHKEDTDSVWYVADIFELLVLAALDSNKGYKETMASVITKIQYETGESKAVVQSACDVAITQILSKMDEVFVNVRHIDIFKTKKDIRRASHSLYVLSIGHIEQVYI